MDDITLIFSRVFTICIAIIISLSFYLAAVIAIKRFARFVSREGGDDARIRGMSVLFLAVARWVMYGIILFVSLVTFNVNIAPLLAGAGVIGIAISIALQALLKDVAAGMGILIGNTFKQGDIIITNGIQGSVEHISLTQTIVRDKQTIYHIPNGQISIVGVVHTAHQGAVSRIRKVR